MKRLLLLSYVFPPEPSPGALRPGYLARYLPEFGWNVTVLTRSRLEPPFPVRVISTSTAAATWDDRVRAGVPPRIANSPLRRVLRAVKETVLFPDHVATWIPQAVAAGKRALAEERYDAILGTALPASIHVVGSALARHSGLPWIADYRDPWAGNAYVHRGPIRTLLEHVAERRLLRRAPALTTISEPIAEILRDFHHRSDVHVIPNAYDPAEWDAVDDAEPKRFDLCYTGSMYDGKRSPDLLFAAIGELRRAGEAPGTAARVHFYGPNSSNVAQSAARFEVSLLIREHGTVPRAQAMRAQRSSAAVLLFLNMDPATGHEMGSKYLEYVGAGRPILAFGPPNSVMRDFIARNQLGWFASNVEEAKAALQAAHARFTAGACTIHPPSGAVPAARDLARRFAAVLDDTIGYSVRSIA